MKGIKYNIDGLTRLGKNLSSKMIVKVGVLKNNTGRTTKQGQDEIDNATLGAKMEMGSPAKRLPKGISKAGDRIPPRSWLEVPIRDNLKDYFVKTDYASELVGNSVKRFLNDFIGVPAVEVIEDGFLTGGFGKWKENSPITVALKGSSKPLIETGQLEKSISSRVVAKR